ncbi:hypothetical protein [Bradyrhizobium sp. B120]|uniref:hypothetical protein n=1 Tax=Bradyrhizobium sp. B120 TaxID=3410088 RepID=UPI003B98174B
MKQSSFTIRIVAVPPGEAPYWVREKWIGLELPVERHANRRRFYGLGVLSMPRQWWKQCLLVLFGRAEIIDGYAVEATAALERLNQSSPEAAAWWRTHALDVVRPGRYLVFHEHACQVV